MGQSCPPEAGSPSAEKLLNYMPCVYVLFSEVTNKHYIGSSHSDSAEVRLKSHNSGKTKSTKSGRP
jgi:predicted GIY-YIG superfamily endonuclease